MLANQIPTPGVPVHLVGSPYGILAPKIFVNCVFDGIVSNVVGLNKLHMDKENNTVRWRKHQNYGLIISDAMCMPGMEGGGCFDAATKRLLGIVIPPIRRIDNQPCNFSLVVPLSSILPSLLHVLSLRYRIPVTPRLKNGNRETVLGWNFNSIVQLRIDNTWATGVIVHQKYVITNAHVLRPHLTALTSSHYPSLKSALSIDSSYTNASLIPNRIVYVSRSHFDICVIELKHAVPREYVAKLVSEQKWKSLQPGDPLMTVGYGVFPPISNLQASVTKGVLTRTISSGGNPILIITSTHVHQGTSGGGVFSPSGYLLGLVVNNIRTHDDIVYTKLNFAIPGIVISRVVTRLNAVLKRFEGYGCNDGPDLEAETWKVWKMFALDESGCKIWEMDDTRAVVDSDMKSKL
ncbi:trypsin-like cysteine/serine peptidase domain-containing protein [Paraphysoderma sedebokerense]|nr:trypsin-like cysteine/serine peptidase domain-containing protein [Paraphysoderma sedebokerense]